MNVYEIVTERLIEKMNEGIIPWRRPWKRASKEMFPCYSYSTGKRYDLINQMLLDFEPGDYITYQECKKAGGNVKKGAKSKFVVGWIVTKETLKDKDGNAILDDDGEEMTKTNFALRYYNVFNVLDCENITPKHEFTEIEPDATFDPCEKADEIINNYLDREPSLRLENRPQNRAYYSPAEDLVVLPDKSQFGNVSTYYSTAFHELTHSTLKKSRCDRENLNKRCAFGSTEYSKEELVAEIGASALTNVSGLECDESFNNSTAYLQSWIKALKNDPKMIVEASAKADKAVNYILG